MIKRKQPNQERTCSKPRKALLDKIRSRIVSVRSKRKRDPITLREICILPGEWALVAPDEKEQRELKRRIISIVLVLFLMIGSFIGAQAVYRESKEILPNAIALRSEYGMNFDFSENAQPQACRVSVSQGTVYTENSMQYHSVNAYYTDANLPDFIRLDMVDGCYFRIMEFPGQNKNIVISEEIAVAQFKTHKAVGYKLLFNEEEYTVCGVYRENNSLLSKVSSNGYSDVYLPYMAADELKSLPVHMIYVDTAITSYTNAVVGALSNITKLTVWPQHITSYPDLQDLMLFFRKLLTFMVGAAFIVVAAKRMWHYTVPAYRRFTADEHRREGFPYLVRAVFWLLVGIGIFLSVRFELIIPQSVLPKDNIFDFGYYANEILSALQAHHLLMLYDFHWSYSFTATFVYSGLILLTAVLFWIFFSKLLQLLRMIKEMNED